MSEKSERALFFDLDGVLADFEKRLIQIGLPSTSRNLPKPEKSHFYRKITCCKDFYEAMPPISEGINLFNHCSKYSPQILSATICSKDKQKMEWINRHLGSETKATICKSAEKFKYGKKGDILIDDDMKNTNWTNCGGVFIYFQRENIDLITKEVDRIMNMPIDEDFTFIITFVNGSPQIQKIPSTGNDEIVKNDNN